MNAALLMMITKAGVDWVKKKTWHCSRNNHKHCYLKVQKKSLHSFKFVNSAEHSEIIQSTYTIL